MTSARLRLAALARSVAVLAVVNMTIACTLGAQTDYYNTDRGRPLTTEDASAVEWRALEVQLAPLRLERARGQYRWGVEPEIAWGFAPRTQVEIGAPILIRDASRASVSGTPASRGDATRANASLAGLELSVLHSLNVETSLPAFAIAARAHLPVGGAAPRRAGYALAALATRTLPAFRVHANVEVGITPGWRDDSSDATADDDESNRWQAGIAIDKPFPLRAMLLGIEVVARAPRADSAAIAWHSTTGIRYQLSPRVAFDSGAGYRFGDDRGWFATVGAAFVVGMPWRGAR